MSATASVPAVCLNAVFGNLIAPKSSARSATYFLALGLSLSIVPLLVTIATIPLGFTLSMLFARK